MAINYNYLRSPTLGSDWSEQYYAFVNAFESIGTQVESLNATYSQSSLTATLNLFPTRASMYEYVNSVAMTGGDAGDIGDPGDVVVVNSQGDGLAGMSIIGAVTMFAGATAPNGWHLCDGSAISRTTYAALFAVIGTTYGTGNGTTTFNLPNIAGRTVVGLKSNETEFNQLGKTGGEKTHTLSQSEMPSHTHDVSNTYGHKFWSDLAPGSTTKLIMTESTTYNGTAGVGAVATPWYATNTGGGSAHNNLQPYLVFNYIIYTGVYT